MSSLSPRNPVSLSSHLSYLILACLSLLCLVEGTIFHDAPVIASHFPDVGWFVPPGSSIQVAYSSTSNLSSGVAIPLAISWDFDTWTVSGIDALGQPVPWSEGGTGVYAPDVVQLPNDTFIMYFSARRAHATGVYCIGAATARSYDGKFTPLPIPMLSDGLNSTVDPSGFVDQDGSRYILYRVDETSQAYNGPCSTSQPSSIMIQQVNNSDGVTLIGGPTRLLGSDCAGGLPLGAPSMTRVVSPTAADKWLYILFFSTGCYLDGSYTVSYATSANGILNGGADYEMGPAPLLQSGSVNGTKMCGPGSATVQTGTSHILWNAKIEDGGSAVQQVWAGSYSVDFEARTVGI